MTVESDDLAALHTRLEQLERSLTYRTTGLLALIFLVLLVAVLLAVAS